MADFQIRKGKDIKLKGAARKEIVELAPPQKVAVQPRDFRGLKLQPAVKAGDAVKVGTPLLKDKTHPDIKIVSPVSGKVIAVNRGDKRLLLEIIIESDGQRNAETFRKFNSDELKSVSREDIIKTLLDGGLWPVFRQRPFSKVADPHLSPKSIFVQGMNTEPLALDVDFLLERSEKEFQTGLDIIKKLTGGAVHLCVSAHAKSKALTAAQTVQIHRFSGPHPAGNVSTHIHHIDPVKKGDVVWHIGAQDVLRVAALFLNGIYPSDRVVAVTGEGAERRCYVKTVEGASMSSILEGNLKADMRYISGSVLAGTRVDQQGYLGFYDSQVTVIPEGGKRKLLGWLTPGFDSYSFSKTFVASFLPEKEVGLDTDTNGSERAIVLNHIYDEYVPLDIMTFFLLRAVLAGDIEECEKLGILECDEEDFALCSFACPSKVEVGEIIRRGLDLIEKEG